MNHWVVGVDQQRQITWKRNKKPLNWLGKQAKRRETQNIHSASLGGDFVPNCDRIIRLFAGWTRFKHFYAILNCSLHPTGNSYAANLGGWLVVSGYPE